MRINVKVEDVYGYQEQGYNYDDAQNWFLKFEEGNNSLPEEIYDEDFGELYTITSAEKADGMWLASPGSLGYGNSEDYFLYNVSYGLHMNAYYDDGLGFRPLVCLKSDILLEEQNIGEFKITK